MSKNGASGKTISLLVATVAFLTGFLLIDRSSISGNVVVGSESAVGAFSIVGLLLVFLALALAAYGIRR